MNFFLPAIKSLINLKKEFFQLLLFTCFSSLSAVSATNLNPPDTANRQLISIDDFNYLGAFRLPIGQFGESRINYAEGPIAYNRDRHSLFVVGHAHQQAIAEFAIPSLSNSLNISDLKLSPAPLQNFYRVLGRVDYLPENHIIDRIGGLLSLNGKLIVNAYEYYDAPADNTLTTLVVDDSNNLAGSSINGYYGLQGNTHAAGWMSEVPAVLQKILGGPWISGNSSYKPIISRFSVGPSAFVFDPEDIGSIEPVPTQTLLDFSLAHPLQEDLMNQRGNNRLWTHMSRAVFGFIPPGTDTYVTLGFSGGHNSGVCYKCVPSGGKNECAGYCAKDASDYHLMYWLWDVNQLIRVKKGELKPNQPRPYQHGVINSPFPSTKLGGGSYDTASGRLYLSLLSADTVQTQYGPPPIILVYNLKNNLK